MKLCCWMAAILLAVLLVLLAGGVALAQAPVISNVQAGNVTATSAVITWTTDELANSLVRYGNVTPPGANASDGAYVTDHAVPLTGLTPSTLYYYEVESTNQGGNTTTDNNGGSYYTFTTQAPPQYTLTINTVGNGTVSKNPDQATYDENDVVELTAYPVVGWAFSAWSGDLTGSANPDTITMDSDKTVTATFTQDQYTLTINTVGNGTVSKDPDQAIYAHNDVVELTADPALGWSFVSWSGDLSGSANPDTITMDSSKTVTATFEEIRIELSGWVWCTNFGSIRDATFDGSVIIVDRTHASPGSSLRVVGNLTIDGGAGPDTTVELDMYGSRVRSLFYLRQETTGKSVSLTGTWIDADPEPYYIYTSGFIGLPNPDGRELKTGRLCFVMLRTPNVDVPLPEGGGFVADLESIVTRFTRLIDGLWDSLIGTGFRGDLGSILSQLTVMFAALKDALGGSYIP